MKKSSITDIGSWLKFNRDRTIGSREKAGGASNNLNRVAVTNNKTISMNTMSDQEISRWLSYITSRSMVFWMKRDLHDDIRDFLRLRAEVLEYKGPKRLRDGQCEPDYWKKLVELDLQYVSLERRFAGIQQTRKE